MSNTPACYVLHGVLWAADAPHTAPADVFGAAPAVLLPVDAFLAIASAVPVEALGAEGPDGLFADEDKAANLAHGHNAVLARLAASHDVAPVKLGAVLRNEVALREAVRAQAPALEQTLRQIAGAAEYVVQVWDAPQAAHAAFEELSQKQQAAPTSGRAYLTSRRVKRDAKRDARAILNAFTDGLTQRLAAHARDHRVGDPPQNPPEGPQRRLDLALLTPRRDEARLAAELESLSVEAARLGLEIKASGPWPAYSFTNAPAPDEAVA